MRGMPRALQTTNLHSSRTLIWALALLGMALLPTNYRADAGAAHGHALLQLWADARDGRVQHHQSPLADDGGARLDWLDPLVASEAPASNSWSPDAGDQNDSAPAGGVQALVDESSEPVLDPARRPVTATAVLAVVGRSPAVPSPPPRWTPGFA